MLRDTEGSTEQFRHRSIVNRRQLRDVFCTTRRGPALSENRSAAKCKGEAANAESRENSLNTTAQLMRKDKGSCYVMIRARAARHALNFHPRKCRPM